ncbi:PaaX family transcriptional regulator C-terminal domain-containing protein, partial [Corynebacterium variabile]
MDMQITPRTLVEAFLPFEGEVSLAEVYAVANLAGLEDQPVRLAIRRLVAAGDVVQHGRGRAGSLTLTGTGLRR